MASYPPAATSGGRFPGPQASQASELGEVGRHFNTSVKVILSTLSPMLNMVAPYKPAFTYNETNGSSQNLGTGHSSYGKYEGASLAIHA